MGELRKDYILDRWIIIAAGRNKRPKQFSEQPVQKEEGVCVFCPGNEALTTTEIGRREKNGRWIMRWFENKFPALIPEGDAALRTHNRFFTFTQNWGHHEVVVETNDHAQQLADLPTEEIAALFGVFDRRIRELSTQKDVRYVTILKNNGAAAGTSIVHSHSQIMTLPFVPPQVMEKVFASRKFVACPYCVIIDAEKKSDRRCFENDAWVAFAPYASRCNYEVWLFPKKHVKTLDEAGSFVGLADILKKVLLKLKELQCSYNLCVCYAPKGHDLHLHIEVLPRIAIWGGFELCTNVVINTVPPEDAGRFYRGETHV